MTIQEVNSVRNRLFANRIHFNSMRTYKWYRQYVRYTSEWLALKTAPERDEEQESRFEALEHFILQIAKFLANRGAFRAFVRNLGNVEQCKVAITGDIVQVFGSLRDALTAIRGHDNKQAIISMVSTCKRNPLIAWDSVQIGMIAV